jgi:hypothetical protein
MQTGPHSVADRTPFHGFTGCGGRHRNTPIGGWAKGMPLNTSTPFSIEPEITPERVRIVVWLICDACSALLVESTPRKTIKQIVGVKNGFDFKVPPEPLRRFTLERLRALVRDLDIIRIRTG